MSTKPKKNTDKGKRYTADEKKAILEFVAKVNADKGRGGQSAAAKQYGVSQLTIAAWLKGPGGSRAKKATKKVAKKAAPAPAKKVAKKAPAKKAAKKAAKKGKK